MSRPRVLKLADGEIHLKNFTKERANEIENLLSGVSSTVRTVQESPAETEEVLVGASVENNFQHEALAVIQSGKTWDFVTLKFDENTKQGLVVSVEKCDSRPVAVSKFKLESFKKGFV